MDMNRSAGAMGLHVQRGGVVARGRKTYICYNALAEAGASVEPVIVLELVDFDALPFARRWWCDGCHSRGRRVDSLRLGQRTLRRDGALSRWLAQEGGGVSAMGGDGGGGRRGVVVDAVLADAG